jgi:hypothetical protein
MTTRKILRKRDLTTIFKRLAKQYDFDYYSAFKCCNSCFTAELPDEREYVYLKHCTEGMNYTSSESFHNEDRWWVSYNLSQTNFIEVFAQAKILLEKNFKAWVTIPKTNNECLEIEREVV